MPPDGLRDALIVNPTLPDIPEANQACMPDAPAHAGAEIVATVERCFHQCHGRCLRWISAAGPYPGDLPVALANAGFAKKCWALYSVEKANPRGVRDDLPIVPARSAFDLLKQFMHDYARAHGEPAMVATQRAAAARLMLDEPAVDALLALENKRAVGVAYLVKAGQLGFLYDLLVLPDQRGRGVAGTLLAAAFDLAQRSRYLHVTILRDAHCPQWRAFLTRSGFARIAEHEYFDRPTPGQ